MPKKPETLFTDAINRHLQELDSRLYAEKTNNPYRGGSPDYYYDSPEGDAWVEYKYMEKLPPSLNLVAGKNPYLTKLQQHWLDRAASNGRMALVVLGIKYNGNRRVLLFRSCHNPRYNILDCMRRWDCTHLRDTLIEESLPIKAGADLLLRCIHHEQPD